MTDRALAEHLPRAALLEIADAVVSGADDPHGHVMHGSMRVEAGELVLVQVASLEQAEIWADVGSGLLLPREGRVRILGNDLAGLDMESGNWLRGRIGRVFSRGGWLDRLSLMDNILLQARTHSLRGERALRREASGLAEAFDLPGIPLGMPDQFRRAELQRAACVRAFLGSPALVLLEDPTYGVRTGILGPLMGAIRAARNRGAAVIWFTPSLEIWRDRTLPATRRYRMAGRELVEARGR